MAHSQQLNFVGILARELPRYFRGVKVLEIGSLDINGSVRQFFDRCDYIGIDVAEGNGVDLVCPGHEYDAPDGSFDQVVSCEVMEHNPFWRETFANMIRVCRPGGLVLMTCATTGRGEHGTSNVIPAYSPLTVAIGWEYYRNLTARDFSNSFDLDGCFACHRFWVNWASFDLCFAGIRSGPASTGVDATRWKSVLHAVDAATTADNARFRSRLRRIAALSVGDGGFSIARRIKNVAGRQ